MERTQREMDEKGLLRVNPFAITKIMPNAAAGWVSMRFNLQGPSNSPVLACTTGTDAVGQGLDLIRRGDADLVVCGASEAPITPVIVAGFVAMRAMSRRNGDPEGACRPYDAGHSGFVIGEGGAALVLESAASVERRGAEPYAKVTGAGRSTDALHPFDPDPEGRGILRAMQLALKAADVEGERVGFVSPHGTGTAAGDGPESRAIARVNPGAMVSATKSTLGHAQGASGAIEAAICALAIKERTVPPMRNLVSLAEDCAELDYVVGEPRAAPGLEAALCANLGVGGHNAAAVFESL
jgi:3-oxoacyl-[acyl-carrier-protein] synthase II